MKAALLVGIALTFGLAFHQRAVAQGRINLPRLVLRLHDLPPGYRQNSDVSGCTSKANSPTKANEPYPKNPGWIAGCTSSFTNAKPNPQAIDGVPSINSTVDLYRSVILAGQAYHRDLVGFYCDGVLDVPHFGDISTGCLGLGDIIIFRQGRCVGVIASDTGTQEARQAIKATQVVAARVRQSGC